MNFSIKKQWLLLGFVVIFLSCEEREKEYSEEEIAEISAEVNDFFQKEFQKDVEDSPMLATRLGDKTDYDKWDDLSHLKYAEDLKKAKKRLEYLEKVDSDALDAATQ